MTTPLSIRELTARLRQFVRERDWEKFHTPRNLATALSIEAAELLEPFQWLTQDVPSTELPATTRQQVQDEMADVFAYLLLLADKLNIDLCEALERKIEANDRKYPAHRVRGSAKKYTEYDEGT